LTQLLLLNFLFLLFLIKVQEVNVNNNYDSNGYRYSGNTPSNYIWFNNEMWRIIGSLPTTTPENSSVNLVKIIRNETI